MAEFDFSDLNSDNQGLDFSDLNSDSQAPAQEKAKPTKLSDTDSFLRGAAQVGTMGFADEALANIFTSIDELTGGEAAKNLAKENAAMGTNITPYQLARQVSREDFKEAEKANPNSYLAGGLVTGLATIPIMGAAGSVGGAAKLGATIGGVSGLGNSEADLTKGEIGKAAIDTTVGAGLGAGLGALGQAAPKSTLTGALVGAGIGAGTAEKGQGLHGAMKGAGIGTVAGGTLGVLPDIAPGLINKMGGSLARNYEFAKETGQNVFNKETSLALAKKYGDLVEKIKSPFIQKQKEIQSNLTKAESELSNLENLAEEHSALDKQFKLTNDANTKNALFGEKSELAKENNKIAKNLQIGYAKILSKIKKTYDDIESKIPENFSFDITDEIQDFKDAAGSPIGGLSSENANNFFMSKKFKDYDFKNMSVAQLKKFREDMQDLKPEEGTMSKVISDFIDNINTKRSNTLDASPLTADLSKELRLNDKQYSRAMRLQDNHIGPMAVNKETGVFYGKRGQDSINNSAITTVKNFVDPTNEQHLNTSNDFLKALYEFDPELAQQFQNEMTGYVSRARELKNAPKDIPSTNDLLINNPEVARLKNLIDSFKNPKNLSRAEKLPYMKDSDAIDKNIRDNIQNMNDTKPESTQDLDIKSILEQYEKLTGNDIAPEAKQAVEGYALSGKTDVDLPNVAQNPLNQGLNIIRSAGDRFSGAYGRAERAIENSKLGYINNTLNTAATKGKDALNAARFDLLQQPAFRQMLKKQDLNKKEEKEK